MPNIDFQSKYKPQNAIPANISETYIKVPASQDLQPFINNFWGSAVSLNPHDNPLYIDMLVIPDTCFDIIFCRDNLTGHVTMRFAALNDIHIIKKLEYASNDSSIFAISIHFWALHCLISYPMSDTLNKILPPTELFPAINKLAEKIFSKQTFSERIEVAEHYLTGLVDVHKASQTFLDCVDLLIKHKGSCTVAGLSDHVCYSKRQVERIFKNTIGISPKKTMDLVRYQYLWGEMLAQKSMDYLSVVSQLHYVDHSHLIADFKKYHSMTPQQAIHRIRSLG